MPLRDLIRGEIERRGPLRFREFMERALYDPDHGYYGSGRAAIGRGGDFVTNVSVGPLFGRLLAEQFVEMWRRLRCPDRFTLVEQGAHRGDFAHDVIEHLSRSSPELLERLDYVIVEPTPRGRAAQGTTLAALADRVRWLGSIEELDPFTGVHFSNELIDAFPVHLVRWTGEKWLERLVDRAGDGFTFVDGPLSTPALSSALGALPPVPAGYQTEINLAASRWIETLASRVGSGYVLAIDYGFSREEYYRPERISGTLAAYAAHRREADPLARAGEIDLTAHVDFTTLAESAISAGLDLAGFTDQHHLMVGLSRLHFADSAPDSPAAQKDLRALQTLMHPTFMGRSFKALCLARSVAESAPLSGFAFARDARRSLGLADAD